MQYLSKNSIISCLVKNLSVIFISSVILVLVNLFLEQLTGWATILTGFFFILYFHKKEYKTPVSHALLFISLVNIIYILLTYLMLIYICFFDIQAGICRSNIKMVLIIEMMGVFFPLLIILLLIVWRWLTETDHKSFLKRDQ